MDGNLVVDSIQVRGNPMLEELAETAGVSAAEYVLPKHGVIRIGHEYLSYTDIEGNSLKNVYRCRRMEARPTFGYTRVDGEMQKTHRFEQGEEFNEVRSLIADEHEAGDMIIPGGYRLSNFGGLYLGSNGIADSFGNGDLEEKYEGQPNRNRFRYWGRVGANLADYDDEHIEERRGRPPLLIIDKDSTEINLSYLADTNDFPAKGIIRVGRLYFEYSNFSGTQFSGLRHVPRQRLNHLAHASQNRPAEDPDNPATWRSPSVVRFSARDDGLGPTIYLVSLRAQSASGFNSTNYFKPRDRHSRLIQIEDLNTGRIEWAWINAVFNDNNTPYFVSHSGWTSGGRGRGRTVFTGLYPGKEQTIFPSGSRVLPVQTRAGQQSHYLETGDVITLMPRGILGEDTQRTNSQQLVVRHAAKDGFASNIIESYETSDQYFTFH